MEHSKRDVINILLCIDDNSGNYSRHLAVTMISLFESNKTNNIKIFILSSYLPEEAQNEIKRIVELYNQEIVFIIRKEIIPFNIKKNLVGRDDLTMATYYRLFFKNFLKDIERIIYLDCDVLVLKDINNFFSMDMEGKSIVGSLDCENGRYSLQKTFKTNHYINAGVLLFDVKKFNNEKITENLVKSIREEYGNNITRADQDFLNIIYKDDILLYDNKINYLIDRLVFNSNVNEALIVHLLKKPYIDNSGCPKKFINLYNYYLNKTKWKTFTNQNHKTTLKDKIKNFLYNYIYRYIYFFLKFLFGGEKAEYGMINITNFLHKLGI